MSDNLPVSLDEHRALKAAEAVQNENQEPIETIDPLGWEGEAVPARRWIIPGWVPHGNVTMLNGDGGVGKSLLVLQLLIACALNRSWLGQPAQHYKCMGIFCEDDPDELHRRCADILALYQADFGDLEDLLLISRVGCDNVMMLFDRRTEVGFKTLMYHDCRRHAIDFGAQVVALDTAADVFAGLEYSRVQVRTFINALRRIAMDVDGAVLLTAHPSAEGMKTGTGTSGSTGWSNTVRQRLYLQRPKVDEKEEQDDKFARVLTTMKANYAETGNEIPLRWHDGAFEVDIEEVKTGGMVENLKNLSTEKRAEEAFMMCLKMRLKQERHVSANERAQNYAPRAFLKMKPTAGLKQIHLARAMERLFASNTIVVSKYGDRPSRMFECILLAEDRLI